MKKLTQREIILIYMVLLLMLLTGGYYFVKLPSDTERLNTENELTILRMKEKQCLAKLEAQPEMAEELKKEAEYVENHGEDCPIYGTNSDIISEITGYLTDYKIIPHILSIVEITNVEEETAEQTQADTVSLSSDSFMEANPNYRIYKAVVNVNATGAQTDLYSLLDWAKEQPWISVTSYGTTGEYITMTISYFLLDISDSRNGGEVG